MMHGRAQVRALLATILGNLPTTGTRVIVGRNYPINDDELAAGPMLAIYTRDERVDYQSASMAVDGVITPRELTVVIAGLIKTTDDDDVADQIALEVEQALFAATQPGAALRTANVTIGIETTSISANVDTDRALRVVEMNFLAGYRVAEGRPDRLL